MEPDTAGRISALENRSPEQISAAREAAVKLANHRLSRRKPRYVSFLATPEDREAQRQIVLQSV